MKKYSVVSILFLISASTLFGKNDDMFAQSIDWVKYQSKQKTSQAFLLSYGIRYINGHDGAVRYKKYMQFYVQSPESKLNRDTLIDLGVFPVVDYVVGYPMVLVKGLVYARGTTKKVSPHALHFVLNNTQLATSAAITKFIHLGAEKGLSKINQQDIKNFGTACATQVACDAVDEMVIQPLVQMAVGDDSTWAGLGAHWLANMAFVYSFAK